MIEKRYKGAILASISASIGGTTVVLTRYLMPDSDPFSLPGIRYGIGAILLLIILYLTVILIIWIAAKIYRIGILMYGKKPSYKDLIKWLKY